MGQQNSLENKELAELLNTLLEAERAGAKVLAVFLDEYPRESAAWNQLRRVQRDEAKNCSILIDSIRSLGNVPSSSVGEFFDKAIAVQGRAARLKFLNRGQGWVARKIAEALSKIPQGPIYEMLLEMHNSHIANIEACDALMSNLGDTTPGA